jgi:hypothetical protein
MATTVEVKRPIGVTVLAFLAGFIAVMSGIHTLQALGIFPYMVGPISIRSFSLIYALMWGLLVWVYFWLIQMLWRVDQSAWMFLVVITVFNLIYNFVVLLGSTTFSDVGITLLVNAAILIYCMLPGVRQAFGRV